MDEIVPGLLWQGGTPSRAKVARLGITHVLNLRRASEGTVLEGVSTVCMPIGDAAFGEEPGDYERLEKAVAITLRWLREKKRAYVHCAAGVNRSSLVVALALKEYYGISGAKAIRLLRSKRRISILTNERFIKMIEQR